MADSLQVSGVRLVVEGASEYQAQLRAASAALTQNAAELKKLDEQYGRGSQSAEYLTQRQQLLNRQLEEQQRRTQALRDALAAYQQRQDAQPDKIAKMNLAITRSEGLEARYERQIRETGAALNDTQTALAGTEQALGSAGGAMTKAGQDAQRARAGIRGLGDEAGQSKNKLITFGEAAAKAGEKVSRMGGKLTRGVTLPIVGAFTYASKEAIGFEEAFSGVVKTFRGSAQELEKLRGDVVGLSTSGLVTQSKEEISQVAAMAAQLGIANGNILGFSQAMLQMADATNLGSAEAAEGLAQFANITGMAQDEFSNLGSAIVELGNNSASQEDAIVNLGMRLAAAGTTAKMSVSDIMGISAAFASVGMEAEAGGTAVSKLVLDMDASVSKGEKAAQKYAKIAGMTAREFQALWKQDAAGGFTAFIQGLQRVREEGGNVAVTLEQIGIKDQRMRDAMLRAVNAGDLLGQSVRRANDAYRQNTALAEEAAAKNTTFAARMKVLRNRFDAAAMSMGESLMPLLEQGMSSLQGLIGAFGNLDEGQRKMVIGWGLGVAAIGPAMKAFGNVTKAVGLASKALGLLGLPGGPILAGVAAFGALAFAIATIKSPMEQIQERLKRLRFQFDEVDASQLVTGIEKGISAAQKEYSVKVAVNAEMADLSGNVEDAFSDGKITGKERKSLKKQLDDLVKKDVDEAQAELAASVAAYVATLDGLKDAEGKDLFTESEKAQLVEDLKGKTSALTTQLEGYQTEYNKLIDAVYKQQEPVTSQQMAEMQALLEQIATVRAQIKLANDEAYQAAQAMYNLTVEGKGTPETTGAAIGLTAERKSAAEADARRARDAALNAIENSSLDAETKLEKQEAALDSWEDAVISAADTAAKSYNDIFAGGATQAQELTDKVTAAAEAYDALKGIEAAWDEEGGLSQEKLSVALTPEILLEFGEGKIWEGLSVDEMFASGLPVGSYLMEIVEGLSQKVTDSAEALQVENPLTGALKTAMEKGVVLDPTLADGVLADVMKVLDFAGKGADFGLDFTDGIGTAITGEDSLKTVQDAVEGLETPVDEGAKVIDGKGAAAGNNIVDGFEGALLAGVDRVKAAAAKLGAAAEEGLNSPAGIDAGSPSKKSRQSAVWFVQGFTRQLTSLSPQASRLAGELGGEASAALQGMLARPRLPEGVALDYSLSGNPERLAALMARAVQAAAGSQTLNANTALNVQNMILNNGLDAEALAISMEAARRRRLAGYGAVVRRG